MRYLIGGRVLSASGAALLLAAAAAACGCSTDSQQYAEPVAGAANTGTFPNLNIVPTAAATQFTPEETAAKLAALRAAQHRPPPTGVETPEARKRRLKLLADREGDTHEVIEGN